MNERYNNALNHQHSHQRDENYKVFIVPLAYTGAEPRAVVVKPLDAAIADPAVDRPWRPVDIASRAVLDLS